MSLQLLFIYISFIVLGIVVPLEVTFLLIIVFTLSYWVPLVIFHYRFAPWFKLNSKEKENIRENGVMHFTSKVVAEKILREQCLIGSISNMGLLEKKMGMVIWTCVACFYATTSWQMCER